MKRVWAIALSIVMSAAVHASVDRDFKEYPAERFVIETGDGNYKQAYHWSFNEDGQGEEVVIFLNHGSGSEWYREIASEFGACGPDHVDPQTDDYTGTQYEGLCVTNGNGDLVYLADHETNFVPVGSTLNQFMLRKIVGSTSFAAWYWQDAMVAYDSPVHIFMVGRYNVATRPDAFDNVLYWLDLTDGGSVSRATLPPYNFDGYGVSVIDNDERPLHTSPEISAFDNMHLYKAVRSLYPELEMDSIIVEGRSDGGSAAIMLASDYRIWTQDMRDFWSRNLPGNFDPQTFEADLANYLGGDFYSAVEMVHAFYPGCSMGGLMQQDPNLAEGVVDPDGDNRDGYRAVLRIMMSFGNQDYLYKSACDDRVTEGSASSTIANFTANQHGVDGTAAVVGEVFDPADHGFDYKHVYKNLNGYSAYNQMRAAASRQSIEKVVNTAITELGHNIGWALPHNLD